jgi:hypothetical protein
LLKGPNQLDERVPMEVGTIQVNFCKNPQCQNFGIPASTIRQPRGRGVAERRRKMPFRRISKVEGITMSTLYRKIDFIHRQCIGFAAESERNLPSMLFARLYIGVDLPLVT